MATIVRISSAHPSSTLKNVVAMDDTGELGYVMLCYGMVRYGFSNDNMATIVRIYSTHRNSTLIHAVRKGGWDGVVWCGMVWNTSK